MRLRLFGVLSALCLAMLTLVAWTPAAESATPSIPSGEHVSAATSSSFTISLNPTPNATSYRVYIARTTTDLHVADITSATLSATSSRPSVTFTGLSYTTAPWYYRVLAMNGRAAAWGIVIAPVGLQPPTPTNLRYSTGDIGTFLAWDPETTSTGFVVTQATNSSMTQNRVTRTVVGPNFQYSPYLITKALPYFFQIQAQNITSLSHHSRVLEVTPESAQTSLRVMTYNVLGANTDGSAEGGTTIAPWSSRRSGVAALIHQATPDVMGIQEAATFVTSVQGYGGVRQIDDLMELLPDYRLAATEIPPTQHGYMRTGNYIIYKPSTMTAVGAGGYWDIGGGRWGVYQEMQVRSTGAKFLFVTTHLTASAGSAYDSTREAETNYLLRDASSVAGPEHVRVVYAGDFNSDVGIFHAFDGPGIAMRALRNMDARSVSVYQHNAQFSSDNEYLRTPTAAGQDIDYVYVGPGVAVRSWGMIIDLVNGQFSGTIPSDHNPVWSTITIGAP